MSREQAFFDFIHPVINLIHQRTYIESRSTIPCYLRHAIWSLGALKSEAHLGWSERLYQSSRRKLEEAELKDRRFDGVILAQAQTVILIAVYELHQGYFHVAWMSIARAVRLVQVMKLHRLDGISQLRNPTLRLIDAREKITESEEMRRAFWHTFLMNRYSSISTGSPPLIQEKDASFTFIDTTYRLNMHRSTLTCPRLMMHSLEALTSNLCYCQTLLEIRSANHYQASLPP